MNGKLPYEELIAEQLQHLQLPDKNTLWQKMKAELDAALPVAQKRKRVFNNWWKMSVVFITLLGGTWGIINYFGPEENNKEEKNAATVATMNQTTSSAMDHPTEHASLSLSATSQNNTVDNITTPVTRSSVGPRVIVHGTKELPEKNDRYASSDKGATPDRNDDLSSSSPAKKSQNEESRVRMEETNAGANIEPLSRKSFFPPDINDLQHLPQSAPNLSEEGPVLTPYNFENNTQPDAATVSPMVAQYQKLLINKTDLSERNHILKSGRGTSEDLKVPAYVTALPDVAAKRKLLLREMKKQERKEERELAKSYRTYHSFWGESTDRWFAAGIAPYQNIAVAGQQSYAYNSAAGKSIVTDYIPSPYLQLHVTNRVYLLGEFQFNSPQATPSLLLSQKTVTTQMSSAAYTENIYLRKLYYFNMPVSFYYSPVRNFYVGSGLQFSSYNSGLADLEQRSSNNTLLHSEVLKLKDDSLSGMIRGSEWRYLFDANYYYNRFMFGLRYNQALSPFANLHINNALPSTQARNQAFQLYIRYNLVVSGRK